MAINIPETKEVTFTLVTTKKYKRKNKASFLSFISFSNFRNKTLLILWALSLSKSVTNHLASKPVTTHPNSVLISSLAITTSKIIKL